MSVRFEKRGAIAVFTLDNGKVNAITPRMHKEFFDHLQEYLSDNDLRCAILTGAGDRAFCGGDDIKNDWNYSDVHDSLQAHFEPSDPGNLDIRPGWDRELRAIDRRKPIIGAINGPAMGMGFIYVLQFMDIRIATPNALLGLPEIKYGMGGAGGSTQLWRHLPPAVAMSMALTGESMSAEDALHYGLINEIVEPSQLIARAMQIATTIASHPPVAVRVEMEAFYRSMDLSRRDNSAFMSHLYRLQRTAYLTGEDTSATPLDPGAPEQNRDE